MKKALSLLSLSITITMLTAFQTQPVGDIPKNPATGFITYEGSVPFGSKDKDATWSKLKSFCKDYYTSGDLNADKDEQTMATTGKMAADAKTDLGMRQVSGSITYKVRFRLSGDSCQYRFTSFTGNIKGMDFTGEQLVWGKNIGKKNNENFKAIIRGQMEKDIAALKAAGK